MGLQIANATVRIADLAIAGPVLDGLEATNVNFLGPAIVALLPGSLSISGVTVAEASIGSIIWEIEDDRTTITGAIGLRNVTLQNCSFASVGFAVTSANMHTFLQMINIQQN
jgi:hypothetical protein